MNIEIKYGFGQPVYLVTDEEQKKRIVTSIIITPKDVIYELYCATECSKHYDFEISTEKNILI